MCVRGRKVETIASSPLLPQTPGSVSALLVKSHSHHPLNPHAGWGQVQHTQLLRSHSQGCTVAPGMPGSPRITLPAAPASAVGIPLLLRGPGRTHRTPVSLHPVTDFVKHMLAMALLCPAAEQYVHSAAEPQTFRAQPREKFVSHLPRPLSLACK